MIHPYFAGHGYASLRIDLRGSGDSDGYLVDEYGVDGSLIPYYAWANRGLSMMEVWVPLAR